MKRIKDGFDSFFEEHGKDFYDVALKRGMAFDVLIDDVIANSEVRRNLIELLAELYELRREKERRKNLKEIGERAFTRMGIPIKLEYELDEIMK